MATNTVNTSQIQFLDNEGDAGPVMSLSGGVVCIDGSPIDLGSVAPTEIDLTSGHILVGASTNLAADVAASGGFTMDNTGLATLGGKMGYTTVATAAGTTTLTSASTVLQFFTGVTTQTVVLPVVSTLSLGWQFQVVNNSTGAVAVQSSGANAIATVAPGTSSTFTCILITGTTAASWDASGNDADVTAALLTNYAAGFGALAATDSILGAFNKLGGLSGYTTTATAAGTTTFTVESNFHQYFTGSTTQTVVLPVASTLSLGRTFRIVNNSSGALTVNSSGSNLVVTVSASTVAIITCILASGTDAASWSVAIETAVLTASRALATNAAGYPVVATTTATELGYVNGVTSAIQTQLNTKLTASQTVTTVAISNSDTKKNSVLAALSTPIIASVTTTRTNEVVLFRISCSLQSSGGTLSNHLVGYKLDAESAVLVWDQQVLSLGGLVVGCSAFVPIVVAAAGAHTIELMHGEADNDGSSVLLAAATNIVGTVQATQI